ncbi:MAG: glycosyltransferase [Opitutaceae bacterium]
MKDFAIYTVCCGSFWKGFAALVESVRQNSNFQDGTYLYVVYSPEDLPAEFSKWRKTRSEEIVVVDCRDAELQAEVEHLRRERFGPAFLKLNIFEDEIRAKCSLFLDSDMLCLGDLTSLGTMKRPVAVVDTADYLEVPPTKEDFYKDEMHANGGFFTFEPNKDTFEKFKEMYAADPAAFPMSDQDVLKEWDRREDVFDLVGSQWNCIKTSFTKLYGLRSLPADVKVLHFLATKPWQFAGEVGRWEMNRATIRLEYLWWKYFVESGYSSSVVVSKVGPLYRTLKAHFFATIRRAKRKYGR